MCSNRANHKTALSSPREKITLGLNIKGGTSFLIRLVAGDKPLNKAMLDQAVEVIRAATVVTSQ